MIEASLKEEFIKASDRMRKVHMGNLFEDISQGEFFALEKIRKEQERLETEDGIMVSKLAKGMHISPPAASRMLKSLEEKELIQRKIDKNDRRNTYVTLTEKGLEMRRKAAAAVDAFSGRIMERMGQEDVEELIRLIQKMADILEDETSKRKRGNMDEKII